MGRTPVGRVGKPRSRTTLDGLVLVAGAIVLLFAVVGVATAGKYVADKASGSSNTATPTPVGHGPPSPASLAAITRAHAQATAIVKAAQQSGKAIVSQATSKARRQSSQIIAQARKSAVKTASTGSQVAQAHTTTGSASGTTGTTPAAPSTGQVAAGVATVPTFTVPRSSSVLAPTLENTPIGAPNLSTVPASWLVVGYNATFGRGPGSAGSVSVVNRSRGAFNGTVKVVYARGGVAYAAFRGLAAGQSLVLPLNGPTYPGGGFTIQVIV